MCIIGVKPKGASWPTIQTVHTCAVRNPDGYSIAWNQNEKLHVFKTMDQAKFLESYKAISDSLDPETTACVFHARIATHGSKNIKNCHLWRGSGLAFAHNGILSTIKNRDDMTDSETFFRDIFLPMYKGSGFTFTPGVKRVCEVFAGYGSKFAFIDKNGNLTLIGEYLKNTESGSKGVTYYSNSSFKDTYLSLYGHSAESSGQGRFADKYRQSRVSASRKTVKQEPIGEYGGKYKAIPKKPVRLEDIDEVNAEDFPDTNEFLFKDVFQDEYCLNGVF